MKKLLLMTVFTLPCSLSMAEEMIRTTTEVEDSLVKSITIEAPSDLKPVQVKVYPANDKQPLTQKVETAIDPGVDNKSNSKPCRTVKAIIEIQCPECDVCVPQVKAKEALPKCEPCPTVSVPKVEKKEQASKPVKKKVVSEKKKAPVKKKVSLKDRFKWKKPTSRPKIMAKPIFSDILPTVPPEEVKVIVKEEVVKEKVIIPVITEQAKVVSKKIPEKVKPRGDLESSLNKVLGGLDLKTRLEGLKEVKDFADYDESCHERIECMLEKFLQKRASKFRDGVLQGEECVTDIEVALYILGIVRNPSYPLNLSNLDLSNMMIKADTLEGVNFAGTSFAGSTIKGSNFKRANFKGTNFTNSFLFNVDMQKADLDEAIFGFSNLQGVDFSDSSLNGATFKRAKIIRSIFSRARGQNTLFVEAKIEDSIFDLSNLEGSDFTHSILLRDRFNGSNLSSSNFYQAQMEKVKFYDSIFKGMNAKDTDFQDTEGITMDMMLSSNTDGKTVIPSILNTSFNQIRVKEVSYWNCSEQECKVRLAEVKNYLPEFLDSSLRVLSGVHETAGNRAWALCNIKCVLYADGSRSDYAIGEVADFVKKRSPWPVRTERRALSDTPEIDVQAAIYVIGTRPAGAKSTPVDLSNTDLRGVDFHNLDMSGVDFTGSNLRGAMVGGSIGLPTDLSNTIVRE